MATASFQSSPLNAFGPATPSSSEAVGLFRRVTGGVSAGTPRHFTFPSSTDSPLPRDRWDSALLSSDALLFPMATQEPSALPKLQPIGAANSPLEKSTSPLRATTPGTLGSNVREQFTKTKMCPYFLRGHCGNKGDCTFAHSEEELRPLPDLRKTKLCEYAKKRLLCPLENCTYAHKVDELRPSSALYTYKTSMCYFWKKGTCLNGNKCRFAHGLDDLRVSEGQLPGTGSSTCDSFDESSFPGQSGETGEKDRSCSVRSLSRLREFVGEHLNWQEQLHNRSRVIQRTSEGLSLGMDEPPRVKRSLLLHRPTQPLDEIKEATNAVFAASLRGVGNFDESGSQADGNGQTEDVLRRAVDLLCKLVPQLMATPGGVPSSTSRSSTPAAHAPPGISRPCVPQLVHCSEPHRTPEWVAPSGMLQRTFPRSDNSAIQNAWDETAQSVGNASSRFKGLQNGVGDNIRKQLIVPLEGPGALHAEGGVTAKGLAHGNENMFDFNCSTSVSSTMSGGSRNISGYSCSTDDLHRKVSQVDSDVKNGSKVCNSKLVSDDTSALSSTLKRPLNNLKAASEWRVHAEEYSTGSHSFLTDSFPTQDCSVMDDSPEQTLSEASNGTASRASGASSCATVENGETTLTALFATKETASSHSPRGGTAVAPSGGGAPSGTVDSQREETWDGSLLTWTKHLGRCRQTSGVTSSDVTPPPAEELTRYYNPMKENLAGTDDFNLTSKPPAVTHPSFSAIEELWNRAGANEAPLRERESAYLIPTALERKINSNWRLRDEEAPVQD